MPPELKVASTGNEREKKKFCRKSSSGIRVISGWKVLTVRYRAKGLSVSGRFRLGDGWLIIIILGIIWLPEERQTDRQTIFFFLLLYGDIAYRVCGQW